MSLRNGYRVAFCGAGGTGKTTSVQHLVESVKLPTFESASRQVYKAEGLTEDKVLAMTGAEKLELQTRIFAKKVELDYNHEYVTDRTLLDHFAYCLAYCAPYMDNATFNRYEAMTRTHMRGAYTHVFYFPWGSWTPPSDGVRQDLQSWQSQIDAIILGYLVRWDIPAFPVPQDGNADGRSNFIITKVFGGVN